MAVTFNWLEGGLGVEFISAGIVTGGEIIEVNRRIYRPEHLARLRYKIIDRTRCTEYLVSNREVEIIAGQDREAARINSQILIALVSTTPLQFGVTRVWQSLVDDSGLRTEIFVDRASADAWLRDILLASN